MDVKMQESLSVFISYSHKDRALRDELEAHLSTLKRLNMISSWHDGDIVPGTAWEVQILEHLKNAQIILLLLSADFIASDFCYSIEMKEAIARHDTGKACVIPILLRPTDWKGTPFAKLQMLPIGAKAVTRWPTHDDAFENILRGIRQVLDHLTSAGTPRPFWNVPAQSDGERTNAPFSPGSLAEKERTQDEMRELPLGMKQRPSIITRVVQEVQIAFESQDWRAVEDKTDALAELAPEAFTAELWRERGLALLALSDPSAALEALEHALSAEPSDILSLQAKGSALLALNRVEEAAAVFRLAYRLAPYDDMPLRLHALDNLVETLMRAGQWTEAMRRAEDAARLVPDDTAWQQRLQTARLGPFEARYETAMQDQRWDEALTACAEALRLAPDDAAWQQRQTQANAAREEHRAVVYQRLTDGSYLQEKIERQGVRAAVDELVQAGQVEKLHALAAALLAGTAVLGQAPEEVWNQAIGRAGWAPSASRYRQTPRFELRFATLLPADEALVAVLEGSLACAFSPDGSLALSGSSDNTLRLWNLATGESIRVLRGHTEPVYGCAFSPDGKLALSASWDKTLRLWDITTGQTIRVLQGHTNGVVDCAFSPDGKLALSAAFDDTLRLWDVTTGQTVHTLQGHTGFVRGCVFSPDGRLALSAAGDDTLRLWNVATGKIIRVLEGHTPILGDVNSCAFSPDGRLALSASNDDTLRLWDVATGQTIRVLHGHTDDVNSCAFSPDGRLALSASDDRTVRLWDVATGQTIRVLHGHTFWVERCAFSPDGKLALSVSRDNTLRLWDITNDQIANIPDRHARDVNSCAFSPDGKLALSASDDRTVRLWGVSSGQTIRVLKAQSVIRYGYAFSPDGKLALSALEDNTLRLWDVDSGQAVRDLKEYRWVYSCTFSSDGRLILSATDKYLRLWDVDSGRILGGMEVPSTVRGCAFSPDSKLALSASEDKTLRLWDVDSRQLVRVLQGHTESIYGCAFSPDGTLVLSASDDTTLRLWDVSGGQSVRVLQGHTHYVRGCAFSPDGKFALSASSDKTLRLWDVATGKEICRWTTDCALLCCAFGPDGETVSAGDMIGGFHFLSIVRR